MMILGKSGLYPIEEERMDYNFKVAMTSEHNAIQNGAYMYFKNTIYDYTNGGINENGWFTAPIKGIYRFELKLTIKPK